MSWLRKGWVVGGGGGGGGASWIRILADNFKDIQSPIFGLYVLRSTF